MDLTKVIFDQNRDIISTMHVGHIVDMRVERVEVDERGETFIHGFFVKHHDSLESRRLCLDLGQSWFINPGDAIKTRPLNVDRAAAIIAERLQSMLDRDLDLTGAKS